MNNTSTKIPILIITLMIGILAGTQIDKIIPSNRVREGSQKFNDVLSYTQKYYVDEIDTDSLVESAINGMFEKLDPHTAYIPVREQELSEEQFRGNFEGIGVEFQIISDTITVVSPITGGPSEALGIFSGDRIIKVDGKDCIGYDNNKVISTLRGEKGSKVKITIYRPSTKEILAFEVKRDKIPIYSVDSSFMIDSVSGYINLTRFSETSYSEMLNSLSLLRKKGMKNLILDLRNNPGGLLNQAHLISDLFINDDKLIVYTKGRISDFDEKFYAEKSYPYEKIPLSILVNRGSASASEIVAGAVQDWDRGLIIGETTFGKGLVQRPFLLSDGSAVRITVSRYYTPLGRAIQRPYEKGKSDYYMEVYDRESDSLSAHQNDTSKYTYTTKKGRKVQGGGGIVPDHYVKVEDLTNLSAELRSKNIYYQFIRIFLDQKGSDFYSKYENKLELFTKIFNFNKLEEASFIKYIKENGITFKTDEYAKDREYILARLKAYVARDHWKNSGWYYILLQQDPVFQKAKGLFTEAEELNK
ncbi:MAG: S41 family peptidase [Bacteroidetes bacterium]|nr:S41 family peptidase [Bacteroidota bacterium]